MFSSGKETTSGSTPTKANNLDSWTVGQNGSSTGGTTTNSWINTDLTGETVKTGWSVSSSSGQGQPLATNTQTATLTHNGVNWSYKNPAATSSAAGRAASDNSITITGTGIKIYKAMSGSTGYQTYIKEATGARADEAGITVTITLVPNTLPASSPQTAKK